MESFLWCVLFSIIFYIVGFVHCLKKYYEHAEKKEIFEAKGKVYRMVEVKVKSEE